MGRVRVQSLLLLIRRQRITDGNIQIFQVLILLTELLELPRYLLLPRRKVLRTDLALAVVGPVITHYRQNHRMVVNTLPKTGK